MPATTAPSDETPQIHVRMQVIFERPNFACWLAPGLWTMRRAFSGAITTGPTSGLAGQHRSEQRSAMTTRG
jgi:hypothetical protein